MLGKGFSYFKIFADVRKKNADRFAIYDADDRADFGGFVDSGGLGACFQ